MTWYTILFISTFLLFAVRLIISWFFGDMDLDVDLDGTDDADVSGVFSFKGILHFLMGFSSFLFLRANMASVDKINGAVHFGILDYMWATVVGVILMFLLFYGYKLALKANSESVTPNDLLHGCNGTIDTNLGNGQYWVLAHTAAGSVNVRAFYSSDDLEIGLKVKLIKEGSQILISDINTFSSTNE